MSIRRIGVLTSGGDAPGMNPCVRAVVRTALYHGIECYGVRRGYNGLISGDIIRLDEKNISHIMPPENYLKLIFGKTSIHNMTFGVFGYTFILNSFPFQRAARIPLMQRTIPA